MMCINPSIRSTPVVPKCIETCMDIMGAHNVAERGKIYFQVCYVCTSESGTSSSIRNVRRFYHRFGDELLVTPRHSCYL